MPPLGERIRLKLLFTQCKQLRTSSALRAHTSRQLTKIRTMTMFTTAQFSIFRSFKRCGANHSRFDGANKYLKNLHQGSKYRLR